MKKVFIICITLLMILLMAWFSIGFLTAYAQPKSAVVLNLELQILQEQKKTAETEIGRLNAEFAKIQVQAILTNQNLEKINEQIVEKMTEIESLQIQESQEEN